MTLRLATSLIVLFVAGTTSVGAQQQQQKQKYKSTGELALSNDTLDLRYIGRGGKVGSRTSDFDAAFFLSEDRDIVLSAGLIFPILNVRPIDEIDRLSIQLGPKVYAALLNEENNDSLALAVGLQARFVLDRKLDLAISGKAFYAPDILTFGTADNLSDLSARVEIGLPPRAQAFAGFRWFRLDLTEGGGRKTLMDELFVGFGYRF